MRVSPCAYAGNSLEEVKELSRKVTIVTHNHESGLKGAEAVTVCLFMALNKASKDEIKNHIQNNYYNLDFTLDGIRKNYKFEINCEKCVPEAIVAFLESYDFEDAIRNAISIGGDSDTIGAITGSIAESFYGIPDNLRITASNYLDIFLLNTIYEFEENFPPPRSKK
jgi:type I restriction enzyme M protein